ncbi:MAG: hypothetical protein H6843_05980 [Rhodospirillaceae bacterium]|nr:hypothetical protein [Rhodospirillaceae bacterium]
MALVAGLLVALLGIVATVAWLSLTPARYTAWMVVAPATALLTEAEGDRGGRDLNLATVLTGAEETEVTDYQRFLQLLTSVEVAARIVDARPDLVRRLFAGQWDAAAGSWHPPEGWSARLSACVRAWFGAPAWQPPEAEELAERLGRDLVVERVGTTAMRRVLLAHADRALALEVLAVLHTTADEILRGHAARRAAGQIAYLNQQLTEARLAEHRLALGRLLGQQERQAMLIAADGPYAADLVERPSALDRPTVPEPLLVLAAGIAVSLVAGIAVAGLLGGRR